MSFTSTTHNIHRYVHSVPARHISESAAPCPYCLAPPQLYSALPEFKGKKKFGFKFFFFFLSVIAVFVFSDSVKMLVKCLQICAHVIDRPQNCAQDLFVHVLDCDRILVIRALNCARLCVVHALNCARILVVRTLDCAQFLLHPALFQT